MVENVTVHVEVNAFDIHKAINPDVHGTAYQRGPLWRANLRGYVLTRDNSKCVYCGNKDTLELDHVIPESKGGSDNFFASGSGGVEDIHVLNQGVTLKLTK